MRLRVATLNIWGLPSPISRDLDERIAAIARSVPALEADVLAFQEVWTLAARERLIEAGRANGCPHAWHNEATRGGSGLLVLSRYPFVRREFRRYRARGLAYRVFHGDYYAGKGFTLLPIDTEAGPVTIVNTHLHARYADTPANDEYLVHRIAQVVQLSAAIAALPQPVVALGDFNLVEGEDEYAVLRGAAGLEDVAARLDQRLPTTLAANPYRGSHAADERIDIVFTRDGTTARVRPVRIARRWDEPIEIEGERGAYSDHAGLLADLEITPGPGLPAAPDPTALALADVLLERGGRTARERKDDERAVAALAGAVTFGAVAASRRPRLSRRALLRVSARVVAGLALLRGVGALALAERFAGEEIDAFDAAEMDLATLASLTTPLSSTS